MITTESMLGLYREAFREDEGGAMIAKAPGRVNLIGEHTDYNDGFVLPVPLDRYIWISGKQRGDDELNIYAYDYGERARFELKDIEFDDSHLWANYVTGVAYIMMERGYELGGANLVIRGNVPQGAGLGSSGALEMATAKILKGLFELDIDSVEMAYIGKSAENDFVGVQSGIMDQFVSALGRRGKALLIDCRTNEYKHISLDPGYGVVVVNTMVRRELASSAYNERREQCEEGVRGLRRYLPQIWALRDVTPEDFERLQDHLSPVIRKRCGHVVSENARVLKAVEAIRSGEMAWLGGLMYESHESLRDDYEVSCGELDVLVEAARRIPGTIGARMTGAGFGGCTVNIVQEKQTEKFVRMIRGRYFDETGLLAEVYVV